MNRSILKFITTSAACLILFSASTDTAYADTAKVLRKKESSTITNSVSSERVVYRLGLTAGKKRRIESDIKHSNSVNKSVTSDKSVASIDKSDSKSNTKTAVSKGKSTVAKGDTKTAVSNKSGAKFDTKSDSDLVSRFNDCALYNKSIGSVELPSLGIKCDVIFGLSQKDVDAKNKMVLLPCCGVPGESDRSLVLMDHNYQTGDIILDSPYGTTLVLNSGDLKLEYTFENMARAYTDYTLKDIPRDIRTRVVSNSYQMGNDIVLYSDDTPILEKSWTKAEDGEQYLYFITCCSESEGLQGDKWVCRFRLQK